MKRELDSNSISRPRAHPISPSACLPCLPHPKLIPPRYQDAKPTQSAQTPAYPSPISHPAHSHSIFSDVRLRCHNELARIQRYAVHSLHTARTRACWHLHAAPGHIARRWAQAQRGDLRRCHHGVIPQQGRSSTNPLTTLTGHSRDRLVTRILANE